MRNVSLLLLTTLLIVSMSFTGNCLEAKVHTTHYYPGTVPTGYSEYQLGLTVYGTASISTVTVTGPNVPLTSLKYEITMDSGEWRWTISVNLPAKPSVGDRYDFTVTYTNSNTEVFHASVTGTVEEFPKSILPVHGSTIATSKPTFQWTALSTGLSQKIGIIVADPVAGKLLWYVKLPQNATTAVYNFDGKGDSLQVGKKYLWILLYRDTVNDNGAMMMSEFTVGAETTGGIGEEMTALHPSIIHLSQNVPNPFNPATTIEYTLLDGHSRHIRLNVYDSRGVLIKTLVNENRAPARYSVVWDGTDNSGNKVSSGIYFSRLQAGGLVETRKMLLLR